MNKQQRSFGILGIGGVGIYVIFLVIAVLIFEDGVFSPLHCFVSELGLYTGGYFTMSSALIYNIGTIIAGAVVIIFMVYRGTMKNAWDNAVFCFFGILSGVLLIAQGIYTLNYAQYHSLVMIAFFFSVFAMCAAYIIVQLVTNNIKHISLAAIIVAFAAGCTSAAFAVFELTGGMSKVFAEDASEVGRLSVIPFAIIEWAALLLMLAFIVLLAVQMLTRRAQDTAASKAAETTYAESRSIEL